MYFDTHTHLNFKRLYENLEQIISNAKAVGVNAMVVPGTDIESSQKAVEIAQNYEGVYAAVSIHPHHVYELLRVASNESRVEKAIEKLENLILDTRNQKPETRRIVAIGEIGLDRHEYQQTKYEAYSIDEAFMAAQKELFVAQLQLAKKYELAVIIHNREAKADILPLITDNWTKNFAGHVVFHCCEPETELLEFAREHQMFIGVDGDVTYFKSKAEFIKTVPLEMLVLETDAPFLLPEPLRSEKKYPNVPANLPLIARFIADVKGISVEKIAEQTTENAKRLFNLT